MSSGELRIYRPPSFVHRRFLNQRFFVSISSLPLSLSSFPPFPRFRQCASNHRLIGSFASRHPAEVKPDLLEMGITREHVR